jgi:hypothetical protein
MTIKEALLLKVMEECNELSQGCSKAIRFGLEEVQEGQIFTNEERLINEYKDLRVSLGVLVDQGFIKSFSINNNDIKVREEKLYKYLEYSRSLGIIKD